MLNGIKVLNFTHYLQGPSAALFLADLGADVVKVEPCRGAFERNWSGCDTYLNGESVFYLMTHRNQRGLAIDLKSEEGIECIYRLVSEYDVVVENYRPGVMERLGLGYERLREKSPGIIYCSCTGYGSTGPKAKQPGQDLLAQSMSGLVALSGSGENPPAPIGTAAVDQHGATLAALGIVAAIYDREKTGNGHKIDASLLGSALDLQIEPVNYHLNGGQLTSRPKTGLSTRIHQSPYGVYNTADSFVTLSLTPFDLLAKVFTPGVLDQFRPEDQMQKRLEFDKVVAEEMLKKTTAEWIEIFRKAGIWNSPVYEYDQVFEDEQVIHNKTVMSFEHPTAGEVRLLAHPNQYDGARPPLRRLPPALGEHTRELLLECGYGEEEINKLAADGKTVLGGK